MSEFRETIDNIPPPNLDSFELNASSQRKEVFELKSHIDDFLHRSQFVKPSEASIQGQKKSERPLTQSNGTEARLTNNNTGKNSFFQGDSGNNGNQSNAVNEQESYSKSFSVNRPTQPETYSNSKSVNFNQDQRMNENISSSDNMNSRPSPYIHSNNSSSSIQQNMNSNSNTSTIEPTPTLLKSHQVIQKDMQAIARKALVLKDENASLKEQQKEASAGIDTLSQKLTSQESQLLNVSRKLNDTKTEAKSLQRELQDVVDEKTDLETKVHSMKTNLKSIQKSHDNQISIQKQKDTEVYYLREQVFELQTAIQEITDRYQLQLRDTELMVNKEQNLIQRNKELESIIEDSKHKESVSKKLNTKLQEENNELKMIVHGFEKQLETLETQESRHYTHLQSEKAATQEAELDKKRVESALENAKKEITELETKLDRAYKKTKERVENESALLRSQFIADKKKLTMDFIESEDRRVEMQNLMERAIREKRAAENELEKMLKTIPIETERINSVVEELSTKLRITETEKADYMRQLENVRSRMNRDDNKHEYEKHQNSTLSEELYRRVRRAEREQEDSKEKSIIHLSHIAEMEQVINTLRETSQKEKMTYEAEIQGAKERHDMEIEDINGKMERLHQINLRNTRELGELKNEHKRSQDKWKQEHELLTTKYDGAAKSLSLEMNKLKEKLAIQKELTSELEREKETMQVKVSEYRRNMTKLHHQSTHYESRLESVTKQMHSLLNNEQSLMAEKRRLESQIERFNYDPIHIEKHEHVSHYENYQDKHDRRHQDQSYNHDTFEQDNRIDKPRFKSQVSQDEDVSFEMEASQLRQELNRVKERTGIDSIIIQ